jgi:hypothetical protein
MLAPNLHDVAECSLRSNRRTFNAVLHLPLHMIGISSLGQLRGLGHATVPGIERAFEHAAEVDMDDVVVDYRSSNE